MGGTNSCTVEVAVDELRIEGERLVYALKELNFLWRHLAIRLCQVGQEAGNFPLGLDRQRLKLLLEAC
ncbi:hypothetical protein D3C79_974430 [compost metagenome]